jgi:hypothetical protein
MILLGKFSETIGVGDSLKDNFDKSKQCVTIADDYAVGFGKWILKQCISPSLNDLYVNDKGDLISVKELLEIFKKEKRL